MSNFCAAYGSEKAGDGRWWMKIHVWSPRGRGGGFPRDSVIYNVVPTAMRQACQRQSFPCLYEISRGMQDDCVRGWNYIEDIRSWTGVNRYCIRPFRNLYNYLLEIYWYKLEFEFLWNALLLYAILFWDILFNTLLYIH